MYWNCRTVTAEAEGAVVVVGAAVVLVTLAVVAVVAGAPVVAVLGAGAATVVAVVDAVVDGAHVAVVAAAAPDAFSESEPPQAPTPRTAVSAPAASRIEILMPGLRTGRPSG
jgi:hypothetical protein